MLLLVGSPYRLARQLPGADDQEKSLDWSEKESMSRGKLEDVPQEDAVRRLI